MIMEHKAIVGHRYFNITNLIIPCIYTFIGILYRYFVHGVTIEMFLLVQAWLMMYEVSTEYFGYGAIYSKNNFGMEYLKTSSKGMTLVKKSMLTDSILRILRTFAYTFIPALLVKDTVDDWVLLLIFALVLANVSVWSVSFVRYITMYGFLMIVSAPLVAVGIFIDDICSISDSFQRPVTIIMSILVVSGVYFTQEFADRKIKASYSDIL